MGSRRFPGKPLVHISGRPMIQHVYERVIQCPELDTVLIATDSKEIQRAASSWKAEICMTSADHNSGTERVIEVMEKMPEFDHYVNIQADEPLIPPETISGVIDTLRKKKDCDVSSSAVPFQHYQDFINKSLVKVVMGQNDKALYFSRSAIPYQTQNTFSPQHSWKHQGIYAYTRKALKQIAVPFGGWLDELEKLEQLKMLYIGLNIYIYKTHHDSTGVDHPGDIALVENIMKKKKNLPDQ